MADAAPHDRFAFGENWASFARSLTDAQVDHAVRCLDALVPASELAAGADWGRFLAEHKRLRGMEFHHNAHDWLGGYPYESIDPPGVAAIMGGLGFQPVRSNVRPKHFGLFGSGCDEYVYRRPPA